MADRVEALERALAQAGSRPIRPSDAFTLLAQLAPTSPPGDGAEGGLLLRRRLCR